MIDLITVDMVPVWKITCGPIVHDGAVGQIKAVVEIRRLGDDRRTGHGLQRDRLFLGDGLQLVANDLERDRIDPRHFQLVEHVSDLRSFES
jgi:hypothetical protein